MRAVPAEHLRLSRLGADKVALYLARVKNMKICLFLIFPFVSSPSDGESLTLHTASLALRKALVYQPDSSQFITLLIFFLRL